MNDAEITSYRYLRIGIVGAVVLLFASVLFERLQVDCWQTSISAYYYTPVRAIFVGVLMAIALSLIVLQGRTARIDIALNFAGMFAPIVAIAPTTNVGTCYSVPPEPLPLDPDGGLAEWVVANIDNNMSALLITAIAGLLVAALVAAIQAGHLVVRWGLLVTLAVVLVVTALFLGWDSFHTKAHGYAAILMFAFLIAVVVFNALDARTAGQTGFARVYGLIAILMVLSAVIVFVLDWDHEILVLEAIEILLFGVFWLVQTIQYWSTRDTAATAP